MKSFTIAVLLVLFCTILSAEDFIKPGFQFRPSTQKILPSYKNPSQARPDTLVYQFSIEPINLLHSYYDYMIGSYNNLPLWVNPDPTYGGYFLTFHGRRTSTGIRKAFFSYIDDQGVAEGYGVFPDMMIAEGYPSLAMDDVARKPLYAWHGNYDGDTDPNLEVIFAYDAYLFGNAGLLSDPQVIIDNPITMPPPYNTADNEFNWPTVQTGSSPITGMRRVYVLARNTTTHTNTWASENVMIAYADYNAQMLESQTTLTWNYTTIPLLDAWNHDQSMFRRMAGSFLAGDDGKIYYVGYHITSDALTGDLVEEADVDIFVCDNFGEGVWTRISADSRYQGWNPLENFGLGDGYFKLSDEVTPVPDNLLKWKIMNSRNFNAVIDEYYNRIHMPALWTMYFTETNDGVLHQYYYPSFHNVKDLVFDLASQQFSIREVSPKAGSSIDDLLWQPWDADGDGTVDEYYNDPNDPNDPLNGTPLMQTTWPFPHWDASLHGNMMFYYSHLNITQPDQYGNMAMVWQESHRAHCVQIMPDQYPQLAPFFDTPEIIISCSPDGGYTWSEPISLNKVETPELAGMKPMWVYPVNQVKGLGGNTQGFEGKLAMLFYDDVDWGSYVIYPPVPVNGEGYVRFMELLFAPVQASDEQITPHVSFQLQNHPNPFKSETSIDFALSKAGLVDLSIYNVKGQLVKTLYSGRCEKGKTTLVWDKTDTAGRAVSNGIYYYRLKAQGRTETKKMLLLK